jgi:hypothetical protein
MMMRYFYLACLASFLAPDLALAQSQSQCIASARLVRDDCLRAAGGDARAQRRCTNRYLNATNRCRSGAARGQATTVVPPASPRLPRARQGLSKPPPPALQFPKASER